jgi:glutathione S-transferase
MFLAEKGVDIPRIHVDISTGEQFLREYRAINPSCTVPALKLDNGTVISEVPAIWHYIEATYPEPSLLGRDPEERATVLMWERRMELDGYFAAAEAFRNSGPAFAHHALTGPHGYEQIKEVAERGKARVLDFYSDLNNRLALTSFVAGSEFTAADITAVVSVDFASEQVGMAVPTRYESLARWHDLMTQRSSYLA